MKKKYHIDYLSTNIQSILEHDKLYINSLYDYMRDVLKNEWFKEKYRHRINFLFQSVRGNLFPFFNYIMTNQILPNSKILKIIDDFAKQNFVNTNIIGVQIRTGKLPERIEKGSFFL